MTPLMIDLSKNINLSALIKNKLNFEMASYKVRPFPDGESHIQIKTNCTNRRVVVFCDLFTPNEKILPLLLICRMLREFKAKDIVLIVPYLPYMRQDASFHHGESALAKHFAAIIANHVDYLITVDPHLHRLFSLDQIYSIPTYLAHAAPSIASWIKDNVKQPLLIGPDSESRQWVEDVAQKCNAPFMVANKKRLDDKNVQIYFEDTQAYTGLTAILVDDIISTGGTMKKAAVELSQLGFKDIICIGCHAVFAEQAYLEMNNSMISKVVTCNTIPHITNAIDISDAIANVYKLIK